MMTSKIKLIASSLVASMAIFGTCQTGRAAENVPAKPSAEQIAEVKKILREVPLIDGHNDVPWQYRKQANCDINGIDRGGDPGRLKSRRATDIPRWGGGGVGGQFWSVYIPPSLNGSVAVRAVLEQIDVVH